MPDVSIQFAGNDRKLVLCVSGRRALYRAAQIARVVQANGEGEAAKAAQKAYEALTAMLRTIESRGETLESE